MKWFQNHSYSEKKSSVSKVKKRKSLSKLEVQDSSDDEDAIQSHLSELLKEVKKKQRNPDKTMRLLSLTYSSRRCEMLSNPANTRITVALLAYRVLVAQFM